MELQERLEHPDFDLDRVHPVHTPFGNVAAYVERTNDNVTLATAEFDDNTVATVQVIRNIQNGRYLLKPQFAECSLEVLGGLDESIDLGMDTALNLRKIGVVLNQVITASRVSDPLHPPTMSVHGQRRNLMDPGPDVLVQRLLERRVRMTPAFFEAVRIESDIYK
jgi:hypothetical protein